MGGRGETKLCMARRHGSRYRSSSSRSNTSRRNTRRVQPGTHESFHVGGWLVCVYVSRRRRTFIPGQPHRHRAALKEPPRSQPLLASCLTRPLPPLTSPSLQADHPYPHYHQSPARFLPHFPSRTGTHCRRKKGVRTFRGCE